VSQLDMRGALIMLYDGVCGLCNRTVQFTLKRDRACRIRFAPLQSAFARAALARYGKDPGDLDTVYLIVDYQQASERILSKAPAILHVLSVIGGVWKIAATLRVLPVPLLNWGYDLVAKHRYRWFGQYGQCPVPTPDQRSRFIDIDA
jgi:predicted DCC family thiol-disulfide oxidoreductase YuxK